jgi:XapX domain-containing protein
MRDIVQALIAGTLVGIVFALLRQPVPAPPTAAGVAGIVGISVGYWLASIR